MNICINSEITETVLSKKWKISLKKLKAAISEKKLKYMYETLCFAQQTMQSQKHLLKKYTYIRDVYRN